MKNVGQITIFKHCKIIDFGLPNDSTLPAKGSGCRKPLIPMNN